MPCALPYAKSVAAIPAAARCLDHENVVRAHLGLVGEAQVRARAVGALHPIAADVAGRSSSHPVRRNAAVSREDRGGHRLEKAHAPRRAVAAMPLARAAAATPDRVLVDANREAPLE